MGKYLFKIQEKNKAEMIEWAAAHKKIYIIHLFIDSLI